jgi:hypothetical protein
MAAKQDCYEGIHLLTNFIVGSFILLSLWNILVLVQPDLHLLIFFILVTVKNLIWYQVDWQFFQGSELVPHSIQHFQHQLLHGPRTYLDRTQVVP